MLHHRQGVSAALIAFAIPLELGCPTRTISYPADASGAAGSDGAAEGGNGTGGTSGAGGGQPSNGMASLGATCHDAAECTSGFCVRGICCESACDRVCEQCSASGRCEAQTDDTRCGTIVCPQDSACVDFATSITSQRCAARAECKTAEDCPFVPRPASTYCGGSPTEPRFCDGTGSCGQPPTVGCGADPNCPTAPGACCYDTSGSGQTTVCLQDASSCNPSNSAQPCLATSVQCDGPNDCSPGSVCCYACGLGWTIATASCVPAGQCDQNSSATSASSHKWICDQDSDCAAGYKCLPPGVNDFLPPGYKVCTPST